MKSILYERMVKIKRPPFVIRLWIQDDNDFERDYGREVHKWVDSLFVANKGHISQKELAELILMEFPFNAVEVLDDAGNGEIVYSDWP